MENRTIPAAIISTDPELREALREALTRSDRGIRVGVEIALPFEEIGTEQLDSIRQTDPGLIVLDFGSDPVTGLRLAQFLNEMQPARQFIATGPTLTPELLLQAMRAGVGEYLPRPVTPESLEGALSRMERRLGPASSSKDNKRREPAQLYAVFSAKGGSGSTTVATNLAVHLHQLTKKRTLLLDLDLELGEIAVYLGMQPRFNFVDMIRNFHRMDAELLASYIEHHESGVHLLSAPFHPERGEVVNADNIRKILYFLRQHYDYVVVDTSKSFSPATLATLEQADSIFLVTTVDLPSLRNIKRSLPLLERVAGKSEKLRLVINRFHADDLISVEEVERTLGLEVYWKLANDYDPVIRSINAGKPIVLETSSNFARDLRELGAELAGLRTKKVEASKPFESLRKLFRRKQEAPANV